MLRSALAIAVIAFSLTLLVLVPSDALAQKKGTVTNPKTGSGCTAPCTVTSNPNGTETTTPGGKATTKKTSSGGAHPSSGGGQK